jgi:hypothetical protein
LKKVEGLLKTMSSDFLLSVLCHQDLNPRIGLNPEITRSKNRRIEPKGSVELKIVMEGFCSLRLIGLYISTFSIAVENLRGGYRRCLCS